MEYCFLTCPDIEHHITYLDGKFYCGGWRFSSRKKRLWNILSVEEHLCLADGKFLTKQNPSLAEY